MIEIHCHEAWLRKVPGADLQRNTTSPCRKGLTPELLVFEVQVVFEVQDAVCLRIRSA